MGQKNSHYSTIDMMAYSAPMISSYFLLGPTFNILAVIYAKYFGLELTAIAAIILYARLFDAITDPLIGYASDLHRNAGGSRKTWVVMGGTLLLFSTYYLFTPPSNPQPDYYLFWLLAFYLAFTLMEIPHATWGGELTDNYKTRSTIYSYRTGAIFIGYILWVGFPLLPFYESSEFTPEVLNDIALAGLLIVLLTTAWMLFRAPNSRRITTHKKDSLSQVISSITRNKPLLLLLTAYLFTMLGVGMWQGLTFLYMDSYMGLGYKFAIMQLLSNIVGLAAVPVWKHLAQLYSKSTIWIICMGLFVFSDCAFLLLEPTHFWQAALLMAAIHMSFSCLYIIIPSLLSDIVDYGELKFSRNRGATYFSLSNLMQKMIFGLGSALSLAIAGYYGVDATSTTQTPPVISGLHLAYIYIPTLFILIAMAIIALMPINRHRHHIICCRLLKRRERALRGNTGNLVITA